MKKIFLYLLCVAAVLLPASCGDDEITKPEPKHKVEFKNLQDKDDILFNLELAYNQRRIDEYDRLLDDNFIFILSEEDYNNGEVDVPQWDRQREVSINSQILNPNLPADLRVVTIDLSLGYGSDGWTELPPNQDHPGESWYVKTVDYDLVMKTADDWEHRALGLYAEFTVRWAQTANGEHWRIVVWRDDVSPPPTPISEVVY